MKITVVGHDLISPRQYLLWHKVRALGLAEVQILAPERWRDEIADPKMVTPIKIAMQNNPFNYMMHVDEAIGQFKPDWIVSMTEYWRQQSLINLLAAKKHGCRIAFFRWENLPLDNFLQDTSRNIETKVLESADLLICGNNAAVRFTEALAPTKRIVKLPETGIDTDVFKPSGTWHPRVLYVGRDSPEKGIHILKASLAGLPYDALLVTDGKRPYHDLAQIMSESTVGILPSVNQEAWMEQFCYVIGEMLACGCPVIASDCGSIPETWSECGSVRIVPQNSVVALRAAIMDAMTRGMIRDEGPVFVRERYSNDVLARKYVEALASGL